MVYPFTCRWMFKLFSVFLGIVNNAAINTGVHIFVWTHAVGAARGAMARSLAKYMLPL